MRNGELDLDGLNSHAQAKLYEDLDYLQIPVPEKQREITAIKKPFDKISPGAVLSGKSFTTSSHGFQTAYTKAYADQDCWYYEIVVVTRKYTGSVRIGIANSRWSALDFVGRSENSLSICSTNSLNGLVNEEREFTGTQWPSSVVVGV